MTFGLPVLNRANGAYKRTAGLFVNQSPVKFCAERDLSFAELLGRISTTLKAVYRHQRLPASEIRQAVGAEVAQSRLFAVGLDFVYNQAYFTAVEIRGLQSRFGQVLDSIVCDSDQPIRSVSILPEMERQRLVMEWNATDTDYPQDQCVPQLVEEQVRRTPEATALVFEDKSLSYWELNARANQLAHYLIQLGIKPDDRVAIAVERSLEMVVGLLAILKAGGAYVPLDPAYREERLRFMVEDSQPVALLVHGATRQRFEALAGQVPLVDLEEDAAVWAEHSTSNPDPAALGLRPDHLAYVIYTSGSTGVPKGVMVEHLWSHGNHCVSDDVCGGNGFARIDYSYWSPTRQHMHLCPGWRWSTPANWRGRGAVCRWY